MGEIGIGLVGGGYLGKAHAVAMAAVGAVFDPALRPRLELIAASTPAMTRAAEASGLPNMLGFNYARTPATHFVRQLLAEGAIGRVTWFRGEHTEDFLADPASPATGRANGTMGDLAPQLINGTLALMGAPSFRHGSRRSTTGAPVPRGRLSWTTTIMPS